MGLRRKPRLGHLGLLIGLAGSAASAQDATVSVRVYNRTGSVIEVRVDDLVCRRVVFVGEIQNDAAALASACPDRDGNATVTVTDRFGRAQTFEGLENPAIVEFDPPSP